MYPSVVKQGKTSSISKLLTKTSFSFSASETLTIVTIDTLLPFQLSPKDQINMKIKNVDI